MTRRQKPERVAVRLPEQSTRASWLRSIRLSGFTIATLTVLVLTVVVLAPSLRIFVEQQQQLGQLRAEVDAQKAGVKDLNDEHARWGDPSYIEAQARERLNYVYPGEYSYLVINDSKTVTAGDGQPISTKVQTTQVDWVRVLLSSVFTAGLTEEKPDKIKPPRGREAGRMTRPPFPPPTADDIRVVSGQLGRPARGVVGIAARCVCGAPTVVATAPRLDDGTPFPTLYYLSHPAATAAISTLEANGMMAEFTALLAADTEVRVSYMRAHEWYLADRIGIDEVPEIAGISAGGMPNRVKCLHALVAQSLAVGPGVNPIGDLAFEHASWSPAVCECVGYDAVDSTRVEVSGANSCNWAQDHR